jgi:hypothetical protein
MICAECTVYKIKIFAWNKLNLPNVTLEILNSISVLSNLHETAACKNPTAENVE